MVCYSTILNFFLLLFVWSTSTANCQTVEDQSDISSIRQVLEKYNEIKEVLAARDVTKLEEKIGKLEEKVALLEEKVTQQESLLNDLQNKQLNSVAGNNVDVANQPSAKKGLFRTCHEIHDDDLGTTSGWYWIDPDGQDVGDNPIYVFCNMDSEAQITTSVPHDSETKTEALYCLEPGCYSKKINYNATIEQMAILAELSTECHQSFKYDCIDAPFEYNGIQFGWWNDRSDAPQYFWSGSAATQHQCECGIDASCFDLDKKCNCDSDQSGVRSDSGIIRATELLPITQLNFGMATGSGQHTLGRFECTGQVAVIGMPTSCADLRQIGHNLRGLYSVRRQNKIETVYCDFSKPPTDPSYQTSIGYADVKSSPVYFYVQRNTEHKIGQITFPTEKLNVGNAMDRRSGVFTAPKAGIYSFSFSGVAFMASPATGYYLVALVHNDNKIGYGRGHFNKGSPNYQTLSLHSTLHLNAGDRIWMQEDGSRNLVTLSDNTTTHYTHFAGMLLQEDLEFN